MTDNFSFSRLRRLRNNGVIRGYVSENSLDIKKFVYPLFIRFGVDVKEPISSMPGCFNISLDHLKREVEYIVSLGITGVLLFGIPEMKDAVGSDCYSDDGIIQEAIKVIKDTAPDLYVITDICLCEYTDHGHCGIVENGVINNDETIKLLGESALTHVQAGADMVAPSAMMDGQVKAIRSLLDAGSFTHIPIMGYSAKYSSAFYGPFREAADSTPSFGDRKAYQMDPSNRRMALEEVESDIKEGADIVMVKPALSYLDVIHEVRQKYNKPLAAYNVSGEYSLIKAAAEKGWVDEKSATLEVLTSISRAGADMIISYHAKDVAQWLA
ncbi:MAG: porphobilinogen synthase [SAR202 cluster bacterium]|jgi:porphobilinogen synthase|nr:porphobilinogen synthase [Dehalococcoidia bacterium]MQG25550.1 porphobilinogen synthase [SAR202 cluster bacterium]MQG53324.1 porphobilinogen synthase [SAR202 cluster bacterium]MQG60405.1 porphobilinogen synthase [SAR202 cluster bacterium]CAI8303772.1 MAG: Delta-aminolevulinic acid dehydratase [Chloroflexota bacterium]|tara:strand:+ start:5479 stop:6456 length:978 start_codon:yes stop_codon:yes gene_type:complete